ncbi:MAG: UDP-N-acetylmuramoyl-L-alanyl-D-glutamate--2,6-diaminopimelate ligase [Nitrospirae bacterium]|nr:MAG: UDP-N-acetylmuramoyl-L-alanyl-D-glutamate--2,6-diaminopimelate ligase [Nitrospirota bacterium]
MKLSGILQGIETEKITGDTGVEITGMTDDSRTLVPGGLFVAVNGEHADGHGFVADAVKKGAAAVLYERPEAAVPAQENPAVVFVRVADSRAALAAAAANFYGRPSETLQVIGITGTNGKTTTSYIIKAILEAWGRKVGLIGTIQYMIGSEVYAASHTTPGPVKFQGLLREMLQAGCSHVITEVSSHALAQRRVDGTLFRTVIFTNLTRDHLDFHDTMEGYYHAKERLFTELLNGSGYAVINADDDYGRRLQQCCKNLHTYGLSAGSDLMATKIENLPEGLRFKVLHNGKEHAVVSPLIGLPNVYNILAAMGAALSSGMPMDLILEGIRGSGTVPGRFEQIEAGQPFLAVIDYAHTEDALERLIYTARGLASGKIITVFGCGGNRDRGKRPRMGAVATRLSDFVIITSDNPRSERPEEIIREIEAGAVRKNYMTEPDRKEAIRRGVMMAGRGDVLLVAGKGHEDYQEAAGQRYAFSDREVLQDMIRHSIIKR